jgi:integrase
MRLSQTRADKIRAPGRYGDGRGLYLQITKTENRSWIFRYELNGHERYMGLGPCADFTLEEARERARLARQLLKDGVDPIDTAHETRAKAAKASAQLVTFKEAAQKYYEFHSPKWKNEKDRKMFNARFEAYVYPLMGALPVGGIDKPLILKALQPIWEHKHATAVRTLKLIKSVLDYAKVSGYRDGENPAAWSGNLSHALPTLRSNEHHSALHVAQIHEFMNKLAKCEGVAARALEFAILTAARTGEIRFARWSEIDVHAKLWTVPAESMKTNKPHRVPLAPRALEILSMLPREDEDGFVFIGADKAKPLGHGALRDLLIRLHRGITVHGFRSTFRDWAAERTSYPNHVVEQALAHTIGNAVERAYRRGDLLAKRAHLMADWAHFCTTPQRDATVTPIRVRR